MEEDQEPRAPTTACASNLNTTKLNNFIIPAATKIDKQRKRDSNASRQPDAKDNSWHKDKGKGWPLDFHCVT
ncbi:uncharacterized protein Dsimw501_GD29015 [Drosophila simulans]|nr:uncharacterized protein Dsimw501_GD29015 [Drosophila simulans]